jgi:hypothetical protein
VSPATTVGLPPATTVFWMESAFAAAPPATVSTTAADVAASPLNQDLDDNDMWNPL